MSFCLAVKRKYGRGRPKFNPPNETGTESARITARAKFPLRSAIAGWAWRDRRPPSASTGLRASLADTGNARNAFPFWARLSAFHGEPLMPGTAFERSGSESPTVLPIPIPQSPESLTPNNAASRLLPFVHDESAAATSFRPTGINSRNGPPCLVFGSVA